MERKQLSQLKFCTPLILLILTLAGCAGKVASQKDIFDYEQEASQAYAEQDYALAAQRYEYLVDKVPKDAEFWFRLANSYAKNGQPAKAINAYQNTLVRDSSYAKAWYNMGMIQMQQALRTFIDLQEVIPPGDPVRQRAETKVEGLFELLGNKKNSEKE